MSSLVSGADSSALSQGHSREEINIETLLSGAVLFTFRNIRSLPNLLLTKEVTRNHFTEAFIFLCHFSYPCKGKIFLS